MTDEIWALTFEHGTGSTVLRPSGPLDLVTAPQLRAAGADALALLAAGEPAASPRLVIDLGGVTFLDSTGLGVLVTLWHDTRSAGGRFAVERPSPAASRILDITGVADLFGDDSR